MGLLDTLRSMFGGSKPAPAARPGAGAARDAAAAAQAAATTAGAQVGTIATDTVATASTDGADPIRAAALGLVGPGGSGLPALLEKLKAGGLGETVDVWVGTGDNMPVSPGGLTKALGADKIAEIAGSLGLPEDKVAAGLAKVLPEIIDKLTPEGFVPDADGLKRHFTAQFKS